MRCFAGAGNQFSLMEGNATGAKYLAESLAFRLDLMLYNSRPIAILADLVQANRKSPADFPGGKALRG